MLFSRFANAKGIRCSNSISKFNLLLVMRNNKKVTEKDSDYSYHEMDSACIGFINKNVVNTLIVV